MAVLIVLGVVSVLLCLHPYVIYPLSLCTTAPKPVTRRAPTSRRSVAICMCAYNEAPCIAAKVETLLASAARYGPAEVFIFVDGASDATADLLAPYADRVRLTISSARRGKTFGMRQLVAQSQSELLLFTDANVVAPVDALERLVDALDDSPDICGVSARLRYTNADQSNTAAAGAAYWSLEETIKKIESRRVGLIGVDGAMFVMERDAYPQVPEHLIDDLYVSLQVLLSGKRIVSEPTVVVEERSAVRWQEEFHRKERIACQAWNVHLALWPQLRRMPMLRLYSYISHRILKWLTPFTLLAAAVFLSAALALGLGWAAFAIVLAAILAFAGLGLALRIRLFQVAGMASLSLAGVAVGVLEAVFTKRTYTVWSPAKSVRS